MGQLNSSGYGAHRSVYEKYVGPVPDGYELDHLCRNRWCVNPEHLEVVSRSVNLKRIRANDEHCAHGHPWRPERTRYERNGTRYCMDCKAKAQRERTARRRHAGVK